MTRAQTATRLPPTFPLYRNGPDSTQQDACIRRLDLTRSAGCSSTSARAFVTCQIATCTSATTRINAAPTALRHAGPRNQRGLLTRFGRVLLVFSGTLTGDPSAPLAFHDIALTSALPSPPSPRHLARRHASPQVGMERKEYSSDAVTPRSLGSPGRCAFHGVSRATPTRDMPLSVAGQHLPIH